MANETENLDSLNEETELDENIALDALKTKHQETVQKNKQLFERAKNAESELKELKADPRLAKPKEPEVKPPEKSDDFGLLHKTYLRAAGVVAEDEVELAKDIQKKTGLDWDKLVDDDYFKAKLDGLRTTKANALATANIKGDGSGVAKKEDIDVVAGNIAAGKLDNMPTDKNILADAALKAAEKAKGGGKVFYDE